MKTCSQHHRRDRPANGHTKAAMLPLQGGSSLDMGDVSAIADARDLLANLLTRNYTGRTNPNYSVHAFVLPEPN